ncbi:MAG: hypothetical protein AAF478_03525 [Pseudomonadota bacterium]
MTKVLSGGLQSILGGKKDDGKQAAQLAADRRVSQDRQKASSQADEARKAGSRKTKRGRRLFVDEKTPLA